jgi:hypothetical protein
MAKATGMSSTAIFRIWHAFGLQPHRTDTFKLCVLSNSKTGKGLALTGHFREDFVFATPGDTTAGIETVTGQLAKVTAPGRGIVFLDSGITVSRFSPTGGVDLFQSGRHDLTTGNVSQLCAALL